MVDIIEYLTKDMLNDYLAKYAYVLLYKTDTVKLLKADNVDPKEWEDCLEARMFSETEELHALPLESMGVVVNDSGFEEYEDAKYIFADRYKKAFGYNHLIVREYYSYDEDGQAYVIKTRLVKPE